MVLCAKNVAPDEFGNDGFNRLPDDFYTDLDGTALSAGFHHTCALEMRTNIEFGGALRCESETVDKVLFGLILVIHRSETALR